MFGNRITRWLVAVSGAVLAVAGGATPATAAPAPDIEVPAVVVEQAGATAVYPSIAFGNVVDVSTRYQFTASATFTVATGFYDYRWWADGKQIRPIYQGNCWTGPTCTVSVPPEIFINYTGAYQKLTLRVYAYAPSNIQVAVS